MEKKTNETLKELITGVLIMGCIIEAIQLAVCMANTQFASAKLQFAVGLWIGVATAVGLAVHMYRSIDRAFAQISDDAEVYMRKRYLVRTAVILVMAGVVTFFKLGYVMAYFIGVLCLKFGAFLQPLIHMFRERSRK